MGFSANKSKNSSTQQAQSVSTSSNQAFPFLQEQFGSSTALTGESTNAIRNLLGLGGTDGQNDAFNNFRNSSGYNFIQEEGMKGINTNLATKGLLGSGAALKEITKYNSNLANSFLDSYLSNLGALSDTGLKAGSLISGAGGVSQSNSNSSGSSSGSSFGLSVTGKK